MEGNFKAPIGKLPEFTHFLLDEQKWVVTPDQPEPDFVQARATNFSGQPLIGSFPPEKEVEVIALSFIHRKKKPRSAPKPAKRRQKPSSGIQIALELF